MGLRLVVGPSGSGKTYFLYKYALEESARHPERNYIIIVPEQFTLSTQRELIRLSERHGILNVDVLSFNRLAYRIFEETGFKDLNGSALDDMGKNLILMHAATSISDGLTVFSENINKLGYITEIKSAISELMQYGISPEKLKEMTTKSENGGKKLLASKLKDIEKLYTAFNDYIRDKFITTEEVLTKAAAAAVKSEKLKSSVIIFDGFTGFTPVQYALIESLLRITVDMYFSILGDQREKYEYNKEHELFYLGFQTKEKLYSIAKNNNICIEKEYIINEEIPVRYRKLNNSIDETHSELVHLERNIFRNEPVIYKCDENGTEKPTNTVNRGIALISALQPVNEVVRIAVEIQKIVQNNERIRYKDIAIATADMENYIPHFKRIFQLYNIPYFIDRSQPVLLNPFIEFVRSVINIITDDFSYNAVFRLLRSPLLQLNKSEIDMLDNFVLAKGIKGYSAWNTSFVEKYGCNSKITDQYDLNTLDIIRGNLIKSLSVVNNLITDGNKKSTQKPTISVNEINLALISIFETLDIENRLQQLLDDYSISDDMFSNNHRYEYENIYKNTIDLLNKMSELLGDEIVSFDEYGKLLDAGFDEIRIGIIPKITDYIQIGDTTRSRFNDIQVLFIVGANDGNIPGNTASGGVISDIEKEFLLDNVQGVEFAPTAREKAYTCQLYLYMLMTKPEQKLYLSYSRLNNNSESVSPSYIIKVLTDMFPHLSVSSDYESEYEPVYNTHNMYEVLSDNIKDEQFSWLINLILNESSDINADKRKLSTIIDCAYKTGVLRGNDSISKAVARILYGSELKGSFTKLEDYAECAFKYYLKYGLSLKERELFSFDSKDMGTVFHAALEKYAMLLKEAGVEWTDAGDDVRKRLVKQSVQLAISDEIGSVLSSTFRYKYMVERITKVVDKSVEVMTGQLKKGRLVPSKFEFKFNKTYDIDNNPDDQTNHDLLRLSGTVDRLDVCEMDDALYIKVVDYKSGDKTLDLTDVYKGLSLQLAVYMNACIEMLSKETDKDIIPAGILYYHLDYPVVEQRLFADDKTVSGAILKSLKMKGLLNSKKEIYRLIDQEFKSESDVVALRIKADGEPYSNASVASTDDFNVISRYVDKKICDMGSEILSGNIKAGENIKDKAGDCKYCPYTEICRFYLFGSHDDRENGEDGQDVKVTKDNVLELMRKQFGE